MKKRIKNSAAKFSALLLGIVITAAMLLSGCSFEGTSASDARYGTVRILVYFTVYCEEFDYEIDTMGFIGSAFGIGETGEETDVFVTNRHMVSQEDEYWTYREFFEAVLSNSEADYMIEYYEENGMDVDENYVTIQYTLSSVYILLSDYSYTSSDGVDLSRSVPCSVIYQADEDEADIAILQASEVVEDRVALAIMDSDELEVGDEVYAIGYPATVDEVWLGESGDSEIDADIDKATFTDGVVSSISYSSTEGYEVINHTATISGGNSGGPLVNEDGAVVGINAYGLIGDTDTYYYAVSSAELIQVLDAQGIEYELYTDDTVTLIIIIAIAAVVVAAVIIILVILLGKRKKGKETPSPDGGNAQTSSFTEAAQPYAQPRPYIQNDSGLRIQAESGVFAGRRFAIAPVLRIGRDPARNDLVYPEQTKGISGVHCKLVYQSGQLLLIDLGSTYGTYLNGGQRLAANQAMAINPGDRFYLADRKELFVIVRSGE